MNTRDLYKLLLVFLFTSLYPGAIFGQTSFQYGQQIPLMFENIGKRIVEDTARINQLLRSAKTVAKHSPDSARELYHEAIEQSRKAGYNDGARSGFISLGLLSIDAGAYEEAKFYIHQALPFARKPNFGKTDLASYYNSLAMAELYQGDYASSNANFHSALQELTKYRIESGSTVLTYNNLAALQYRLKQFSSALAYVLKGEAIARKGSFAKELCFILSTKASIYADTKKYDSAIACYKEVIHYFQMVGDKGNEAAAMGNLGATLLDKKQTSQAIRYIERAIDIADSAKIPPISIASSHILGQAYYSSGQFAKAVATLSNSIKGAEQLGINDDLLTAYSTLAYSNSALGHDHEAYQNLQKAWQLKDSFMSKEKTDAVNTLEVKYRTAEKDKQLAVSNLQLAKQERDLARKNLWIGGISATTLLLSGLALGLYRNNRHKQRLQKEQIKTLEQEKDLRAMQSMIQGEEKERARMARELHDGIGGMLTSVEMHFGILEKRYEVLHQAKDYNEAMQALQETTAEVRKTAHNLMPEMLLRHGLPEAIRIFCARVTRGEKLEIDFQNVGEPKRLEQNFELSLYRIVQELVQNIIRHANASQALVQLSWYEDQVSLLVEDNGEGLPPWESNGTPGLGLENLNWRVKSMKGQLTIDSKPGEGTSIYMEFELKGVVSPES